MLTNPAANGCARATVTEFAELEPAAQARVVADANRLYDGTRTVAACWKLALTEERLRATVAVKRRCVVVTAAVRPVVAPGYLAPELGHAAESVRDYLELELAARRHPLAAGVQYMLPPLAVLATGEGTGYEWPVRHAHIRCYAGPAPYVGDPFVYTWLVAVDAVTGRPVAATKAFVHYLPRDPR